MEKLFLDTNILMDHLLERAPFVQWAEQLLYSTVGNDQLTLMTSGVSFVNAHYILRRHLKDDGKALEQMRVLYQLISICDNTHLEVEQALTGNFRDFEDGFQYYTALHNQADAIITRNAKDFTAATLPIYSAEAYLQRSDDPS